MIALNIGSTTLSVLLLVGFIYIVITNLTNKTPLGYIFPLKIFLFVAIAIMTGLSMGINYSDLEKIKEKVEETVGEKVEETVEEKSMEYKEKIIFGSVNSIIFVAAVIFGIISIVKFVL